MRRAHLIGKIRAAAKANGVKFEFVREGREHELWTYDGQRVAIPRHREINERTAGRILKDLGL